MWRRSRFINLLIDKDQTDKELFEFAAINERIDWYNVNLENLEPAMQKTFKMATYDEETEQFLNQSLEISNNICFQIYYTVMATILSTMLTKTSVNGFLNRGGMFVFSHSNLQFFLNLPSEWSPLGKQLIDIGAGDGGITQVLGQFYSKVSVVEASKVMEWRLAQRGFRVLHLDKWTQSGQYDLISALNLLDRHQNPRKLLADIHLLAEQSNCPVLISLVLPITQYVEFRPSKNAITEPIIASNSNCGTTFESQLDFLAREVFQPDGFEIIRWTKLPYLCEGDLTRGFYKLDDAIFLLKAVPMPKQKVAVTSNKRIVEIDI